MEATRWWLYVKTQVVSVALKLNFKRDIARGMESKTKRETRQRNRSVQEGEICLKKTTTRRSAAAAAAPDWMVMKNT
jgi:hypothetical protein